jgi:hypothetical protein
MKFFSNLLLSLILVAFSGTVLAGENEYKATDNEDLFGTWVNIDYTDGMIAQVYIIRLGENERYSSVNDQKPMWKEESRITHKWTDAKGNIWYRARWNGGLNWSGFVLSKISESGKTLEYIFSQWEYPKELDINIENYRIYKRK